MILYTWRVDFCRVFSRRVMPFDKSEQARSRSNFSYSQTDQNKERTKGPIEWFYLKKLYRPLNITSKKTVIPGRWSQKTKHLGPASVVVIPFRMQHSRWSWPWAAQNWISRMASNGHPSCLKYIRWSASLLYTAKWHFCRHASGSFRSMQHSLNALFGS